MGSFAVQGSTPGEFWSQFPTHGSGAPTITDPRFRTMTGGQLGGFTPTGGTGTLLGPGQGPDINSQLPPGYRIVPNPNFRGPGPVGSEGQGSMMLVGPDGKPVDDKNTVPWNVGQFGGSQQPSTSMGLPPTSAPGPAPGPAMGSGDPQQVFLSIMQGLPATPANLEAKANELAAAGIYIHRNAEGVAGKVQIGQGGPIIDVIQGAGAGGGGQWQWLGPGSGGGGGSTLGGPGMAGFGLAPGQSVMDLVKGLPGYQFAFDEAMNGLQRGAAAKGTLLTGGFQKDLGKYLGNAVAGPAYQSQVGNLFNLATLGENAAAGTGAAMGQYGNNASGLLTGIGNAQAAGSIANGNAWSGALGNLGNIAATSYGATHPMYPGFPHDP